MDERDITVVEFVALLMLVWALRELFITILIRKQSRELRHQLSVNHTQSCFTNARIALMELALTNKIDVNSATFMTLYYLHSLLIRRPAEYPQISAALHKTFLMNEPTLGQSPVLIESQSWSSDIRNVVKLTADGLSDIVLNFNRSQDFSSSLTNWLKRFSGYREEREQVFDEIRETKKRLYDLSEAN